MPPKGSNKPDGHEEGVAKIGVRSLINQVCKNALHDSKVDYPTFYERFKTLLQEEFARNNFKDKIPFIKSCFEDAFQNIRDKKGTLLYFPDKHHENYGVERLAQIEEWMISIWRDYLSGENLNLADSNEETQGTEEA